MRRKAIPGLYGKYLAAFFVSLALASSSNCDAQLITVRLPESANRGFLVVRNQAGINVGSGELVQLAHRDRISARLVLRFKDGSIDDETTDYSQDRTFRLIRYHHIQRGPSFPHPMDASIDLAAQQVKTISLDKAPADAAQSGQGEHLEMPEDLSNGLVLTLLKNLRSDGKQVKLPYVAFLPKARLIKLAISKVGQQAFRIGGHAFRADHYVVKPELGGITGLIAPMIGKQPADIDVWMATGKVPALVRVDGSLYDGGPILSIQLANPSW